MDPLPTTRSLSPEHLSAWRAFLEAHRRVVEQLAAQLREEDGLPLSWYDVLVHLSEADGHNLRMQDLAASILLSRSGLTRLIDKMEAAGLVQREACESDGRGTLARMTPAGLARLEEAAPTHIAGVIDHFACYLDASEARDLTAALRRIASGGQATTEYPSSGN